MPQCTTTTRQLQETLSTSKPRHKTCATPERPLPPLTVSSAPSHYPYSPWAHCQQQTPHLSAPTCSNDLSPQPSCTLSQIKQTPTPQMNPRAAKRSFPGSQCTLQHCMAAPRQYTVLTSSQPHPPNKNGAGALWANRHAGTHTAVQTAGDLPHTPQAAPADPKAQTATSALMHLSNPLVTPTQGGHSSTGYQSPTDRPTNKTTHWQTCECVQQLCTQRVGAEGCLQLQVLPLCRCLCLQGGDHPGPLISLQLRVCQAARPMLWSTLLLEASWGA